MNTAVPDKYIRKEIHARIHNLEVASVMFKCFDSRATVSNARNYFLLSTQLNQPERTKCGRGWINSTEIQVICLVKKGSGSRVLLDDAVNGVISELEDFTLPISTGMKVSTVELSIENETVEETNSETVYRKIIRLETQVN